MNKIEPDRTCGTCVVCCIYPSINEKSLKKSALKPCHNLVEYESLIPPNETEVGAFQGMPLFESKHLRGVDIENCTIYEDRPKCCAEYHCAWLDGYGEKDDRPDKSGVVIDDITQTGKIENSLVAKPLWFKADEQPNGKKAIENISRGSDLPICVLQFTEFRLLRIVGRGVK